MVNKGNLKVLNDAIKNLLDLYEKDEELYKKFTYKQSQETQIQK
jgi:hypothetical protein